MCVSRGLFFFFEQKKKGAEANLGLHHGNRFNFSLQNKKAVVIEIDSALHHEGLDFFKRRALQLNENVRKLIRFWRGAYVQGKNTLLFNMYTDVLFL